MKAYFASFSSDVLICCEAKKIFAACQRSSCTVVRSGSRDKKNKVGATFLRQAGPSCNEMNSIKIFSIFLPFIMQNAYRPLWSSKLLDYGKNTYTFKNVM